VTVFGYVGWAGRENLGDDAIFQALRARLEPAALLEVPLYPGEAASFMVHGDRARLRHARPLLGGGTVIGRWTWRVHLRTALLLARTRPAVMIGAGVEDPAFGGLHSFGSERELRRWRALLGDFDRVTVRGPRSQQLLAGVGVDAEVVGDPALLLEPTGAVEPDPRTVGVALGFGDDLWGHSQDAVVRSVAGALRGLADRGWSIRFFVVNPEDRDSAERCAAQAGLDPARTPILPAVVPDDYLREVARCTVLVGQRLHAVVLAACASVPAVMLEYQPKCRDFMESIDRADWLVRTDRIDAAEVLDRVLAAEASREVQSHQIEQSVGALRSRLAAELTHVREMAGVEIPSASRRIDAARGAPGS
jgi:polysaccharide pyruvyl transferase WcaK-like protein